MLALPIFTARHQATIVGVNELNFCVRDGNRWTLITINTNLLRWLFTIFFMSNTFQCLTLYITTNEKPSTAGFHWKR